jgi:hypothetical protein
VRIAHARSDTRRAHARQRPHRATANVCADRPEDQTKPRLSESALRSAPAPASRENVLAIKFLEASRRGPHF